MKDPAFLFYSNDFYEGTRTMLPQERACYIDLLIYQHQHGAISIDLEKILRYCTGIDESTLIATLEAKFEKTEKGWINKRLNEEIFSQSFLSLKIDKDLAISVLFATMSTITHKDQLPVDIEQVFDFMIENLVEVIFE